MAFTIAGFTGAAFAFRIIANIRNIAKTSLTLALCFMALSAQSCAQNTSLAESPKKSKAKIIDNIVVLWYDRDHTHTAVQGPPHDSIARFFLKEQDINFKEGDVAGRKVILRRAWTPEDTEKVISVFFKDYAESVAQSMVMGRAVLQRMVLVSDGETSWALGSPPFVLPVYSGLRANPDVLSAKEEPFFRQTIAEFLQQTDPSAGTADWISIPITGGAEDFFPQALPGHEDTIVLILGGMAMLALVAMLARWIWSKLTDWLERRRNEKQRRLQRQDADERRRNEQARLRRQEADPAWQYQQALFRAMREQKTAWHGLRTAVQAEAERLGAQVWQRLQEAFPVDTEDRRAATLDPAREPLRRLIHELGQKAQEVRAAERERAVAELRSQRQRLNRDQKELFIERAVRRQIQRVAWELRQQAHLITNQEMRREADQFLVLTGERRRTELEDMLLKLRAFVQEQLRGTCSVLVAEPAEQIEDLVAKMVQNQEVVLRNKCQELYEVVKAVLQRVLEELLAELRKEVPELEEAERRLREGDDLDSPSRQRRGHRRREEEEDDEDEDPHHGEGHGEEEEEDDEEEEEEEEDEH